MKYCSKCDETKELTEFNKAKATKDGLQSQCRQCLKAYDAKYRANNKDTLAARRSSRSKKTYRKFYDTLLGRIVYALAASETKRRKRGLAPISPQVRREAAAELATKDEICTACGATDHISVDHIIPINHGGTHDITNLQFLCVPCNASKADSVDGNK